mmetsp:Transcript_24105/g.60728  ORF Transcript_24105/g.60728 Transcript_24105/m.60728 type:complete len:201 (-) Transcript_24105:431-1033(-)
MAVMDAMRHQLEARGYLHLVPLGGAQQRRQVDTSVREGLRGGDVEGFQDVQALREKCWAVVLVARRQCPQTEERYALRLPLPTRRRQPTTIHSMTCKNVLRFLLLRFLLLHGSTTTTMFPVFYPRRHRHKDRVLKPQTLLRDRAQQLPRVQDMGHRLHADQIRVPLVQFRARALGARDHDRLLGAQRPRNVPRLRRESER